MRERYEGEGETSEILNLHKQDWNGSWGSSGEETPDDSIIWFYSEVKYSMSYLKFTLIVSYINLSDMSGCWDLHSLDECVFLRYTVITLSNCGKAD